MCLSATVSYSAAAVLLPTGAVSIHRAFKKGRRYLALAFLPLFFGLQQLFEGLTWTASGLGNYAAVQMYSMAYMLFAWLVWPIWIPYSTFPLEPCRRRHLYLVFAILGGMLGALQYFPYFAHENWLVVRLLDNAISYEGTVLFDLIMRREITSSIYLIVILVPLLTSSLNSLKIFGLLVSFVVAITYLFFTAAYISAFCFGAAVMSFYLVYVIFKGTRPEPLSSENHRTVC
ncbi:MAG: hypothetical protein OEO83_04525 [Alphaproteobacteria bacterium]|nr:hypothetical protein [Alphaproteobacteria bacterium]